MFTTYKTKEDHLHLQEGIFVLDRKKRGTEEYCQVNISRFFYIFLRKNIKH